ncbi:uncharacterized protein LOC106134416 [Amyelois transitella]|uniref:uncharacterized protein LOC106134416 n=1 Tax=Amyelois transitella TaxID=680683 RepID=UPI002990600D|nr:uncharacterized protein LOC106134416 [Amyelois transitella]
MAAWETLRKFGLGHCDLPTFLWNVTVMLRLVVLDIDSRNKKGIHSFFYILLPILIFSFVYVFIFSGIWFVVFRAVELGVTTYRVKVLSLTICTEMGPIKYFYLFLNRSATKQLIDDYLACDALVEADSRAARKLVENMRIVKRRALIYWSIIMATGVIYLIRPALHPTKRIAIDENFPLYGLEPVLESPNYEVNTALMTLACFFTVFPPAQINVLLIAMVGYTESQLKALGCDLMSVWEDAEKHYEDIKHSRLDNNADEARIKNEFVRRKLRSIQKVHVKNIALIRETQRIFRNAFAGELIVLIISLTLELIVGLKKTYDQIPFAFFQIGIECYVGQKLIDAGVAFEHALYDSNWENFDVRNKKTILLMLVDAQSTLMLSAGGVSIMNFELLMSIIKSVYSAYKALETQE